MADKEVLTNPGPQSDRRSLARRGLASLVPKQISYGQGRSWPNTSRQTQLATADALHAPEKANLQVEAAQHEVPMTQVQDLASFRPVPVSEEEQQGNPLSSSWAAAYTSRQKHIILETTVKQLQNELKVCSKAGVSGPLTRFCTCQKRLL